MNAVLIPLGEEQKDIDLKIKMSHTFVWLESFPSTAYLSPSLPISCFSYFMGNFNSLSPVLCPNGLLITISSHVILTVTSTFCHSYSSELPQPKLPGCLEYDFQLKVVA